MKLRYMFGEEQTESERVCSPYRDVLQPPCFLALSRKCRENGKRFSQFFYDQWKREALYERIHPNNGNQQAVLGGDGVIEC